MLIVPNSNSEDARPLVEVNHCHGAGKGHPCEGVATVKKGKDFSFDGNYDVTFSNGKKTRIFYDRGSQNWYEDKRTEKPHTSHYSDHFGFTKDELLGKLAIHYGSKT